MILSNMFLYILKLFLLINVLDISTSPLQIRAYPQ